MGVRKANSRHDMDTSGVNKLDSDQIHTNDVLVYIPISLKLIAKELLQDKQIIMSKTNFILNYRNSILLRFWFENENKIILYQRNALSNQQFVCSTGKSKHEKR